MYPNPGGPKTDRSYGSGSAILVNKLVKKKYIEFAFKSKKNGWGHDDV
jgi:hypothetical protein